MACNTCGIFEFTVQDGMKAFSVAEIFVSCFHVITAVNIGATYTRLYVHAYNADNSILYGAWSVLELIIQCAIVFTLLILGVIGFLLYPYGWKKKYVAVCWAWMITAGLNLTLLAWLVLIQIATDYGIHVSHRQYYYLMSMRIPVASLLYLLYVPYGIFIVVGYVKWARTCGCAIEVSISQVKESVVHMFHHQDDHDNVDVDNEKQEHDHGHGETIVKMKKSVVGGSNNEANTAKKSVVGARESVHAGHHHPTPVTKKPLPGK